MHPTEGLDHPAITHAWGRRGVHVKRLRLELNIRKEGSEVEPRQAPREACSLATRLRRLSKRHRCVALWTRASDSPVLTTVAPSRTPRVHLSHCSEAELSTE
jgi:hypothetical protein